MSCNYLNAELFLLSFHLCLLPLSMVRLSFSLCLSISHTCFLSFHFVLPPHLPSLTSCLCHPSSLPLPSCLSLCLFLCQPGFPTLLGPGFAARAVEAWAKAGGKG